MRHLAGWMSLAACIYGLHADLIAYLNRPIKVIPLDRCIFPFVYGDVIYYNCIAVHSDFDWCSLDGHFQGRWRYCTANDPPQCIFPFVFRKRIFHNCTKEGFVLNRSWCSLTDNYNSDRKWKQCSPLNF